MEATHMVSVRMGLWRILSTAVNRNTSSTLLRVATQWIPFSKQGFNDGNPVSHCGPSIKDNHQSMYNTKGPEDIDFSSLIPHSEERGRIFKANQYSQEISSATSRLVHVVRPALPHIADFGRFRWEIYKFMI